MLKGTLRHIPGLAKSGIKPTVLVCILMLMLISGVGFTQSAQATEPGPKVLGNVTAQAGTYQSTVFVQGTSAATKPDSIVVAKGHVYVGYQNTTAADGSDGGLSTIIDYSAVTGAQLNQWSVRGRCDGLRLNPYTNLLWASVNEDGNSSLFTINPTSGATMQYQWSSAIHGGGYDDIAFTNGMAFAVASAPNLDPVTGINVFPAVSSVVLQGAVAQLTPVLMGNATGTDATTGMPVTLNEVDPDSLSVDPQGNILLVNQAGNEIVTLRSPGTANQTVSRLLVPTSLDDTVMLPQSQGKLFVVDGRANAIYTVQGNFAAGMIFTETPGDSSVPGVVGIVDPATGNLLPVLIGYGSPTGMVFALQSDLYLPTGGGLTPPNPAPMNHPNGPIIGGPTPAPQPMTHPTGGMGNGVQPQAVSSTPPTPPSGVHPAPHTGSLLPAANGSQSAPPAPPAPPAPIPAPQPARH